MMARAPRTPARLRRPGPQRPRCAGRSRCSVLSMSARGSGRYIRMLATPLRLLLGHCSTSCRRARTSRWCSWLDAQLGTPAMACARSVLRQVTQSVCAEAAAAAASYQTASGGPPGGVSSLKLNSPGFPGHRAFGKTDRQVDRGGGADGRLSTRRSTGTSRCASNPGSARARAPVSPRPRARGRRRLADGRRWRNSTEPTARQGAGSARRIAQPGPSNLSSSRVVPTAAATSSDSWSTTSSNWTLNVSSMGAASSEVR